MASKESDSPSPTRRLLFGLAFVLSLWGIYLAVGATGIFTDVGLFDWRRSLIVLGCSACFVGFWLTILAYRDRKGGEPSSLVPSNRASVISLLAVCLAFAAWGLSWMAWLSKSSQGLTYPLAGVSVFLFGVAIIAALIGLSDPRRRRYKMLGLLTLALLCLAVVLFVIQVNRYTRGTAVLPRDSQLSWGLPRPHLASRSAW